LTPQRMHRKIKIETKATKRNETKRRKEKHSTDGNEDQQEASIFPQSQPSSATTARPRPQRAP
jgi:hypothetical protein